MKNEDEIFADALDVSETARAAFLDDACGGDAALRARIDALLQGHGEARAFLEIPLVPRQAVTPEEKPGDRIGRYKLLQKIGEGGCGVVYLAEQDEPMRRRVALKIIKLGMDTKAVIARFEAERQALALMEHPNIARVFDAGATESGRPFFVMEWVRGISLAKYCDEKHLAHPQRIELFITVCAAIHHAHQKGIIHRDIKPSNILVTVNDGIAVPKVIDFGIAKATQGRLTEHTLYTAFEQFIGTPAYMSPEQAEMSQVELDPRSDVYALGVLLYELLTGQLPFDAKAFAQTGVDEIRRQIREVEPPKPSTRWRTLSDAEQTSMANLRGTAPAELSGLLRGDLDWIAMRCLEKDRARRYDTASDLAADLQRHRRHQPISARPPSPIYVLGKFIRRHRFGFAAGLALGLMVVVGAAVGGWQARRASRVAIDPKSIAVLPFENRSDDKEATAFFADGIHDDILTNLAHISELRVVSRTSVMEYRGTKENVRSLAQKLGVAYLLEGSVRRAGNKVRVTGQLIRAATDEHVWAETMDRDLTDVFAIQTELAQKIAAALQTALSPREKTLISQRPTENIAAYDLYLKARAAQKGGRQVGGNLRAQENLLQEAVRIDPNFVFGWTQLTIVHSDFYNRRDRTEARLAKAKEAIDTAIRIAPEEPEVIRALAEFYFHGHHDYPRAAAQFQKLIGLQPNDPNAYSGLGFVQRHQGRWVDAVANFRRALELDPGDFRVMANLGETLRLGRRYAEAIATYRRLVELRPDDLMLAYNLGYTSFRASGSTREMEAFFAGLKGGGADLDIVLDLRLFWAAKQGNLTELVGPEAPGQRLTGAGLTRAVALAAHGNQAAARARLEKPSADLRAQLIQEPTNDALWGRLGMIEAILGHPEEALRCARKAVELVPESIHARLGATNRESLASVYAWTGDKDRAIAEYARLLRVPADLNVYEMRRHPFFFPLQGDPRFEALLNDPKNNAPLF